MPSCTASGRLFLILFSMLVLHLVLFEENVSELKKKKNPSENPQLQIVHSCILNTGANNMLGYMMFCP